MFLRLGVLCLATAYLTDALYLKYKAPNSKALQDIKGNLGKNRYPRHVHDITQWLRNNRRQQLVALDRRDKRVEEFIKELILLIEESHPTRPGKPKQCLENFGSSHDELNEKMCERYNINPKNELNLVIPIPIKRKEQEKETDLDYRRMFNTRRYSSSESSVENRNGDNRKETRSKRFEVVGNKKKWQHDKSIREKKMVYNDYSDDGKEYRSEEDRERSDSEELSTEKPIKKKPIKKKSMKKKSIKKKPISAESDNERYSYIQGSRIMNANRRQNRLSYFLPKRYHWNDDELQHLGYYWFEGNSK